MLQIEPLVYCCGAIVFRLNDRVVETVCVFIPTRYVGGALLILVWFMLLDTVLL